MMSGMNLTADVKKICQHWKNITFLFRLASLQCLVEERRSSLQWFVPFETAVSLSLWKMTISNNHITTIHTSMITTQSFVKPG